MKMNAWVGDGESVLRSALASFLERQRCFVAAACLSDRG